MNLQHRFVWSSAFPFNCSAHTCTHARGVSVEVHGQKTGWLRIAPSPTVLCEEQAGSAFRRQRFVARLSSGPSSFPTPRIPYIPGMILVLAFLSESYCFHQKALSCTSGRNALPWTRVSSQGHQ